MSTTYDTTIGHPLYAVLGLIAFAVVAAAALLPVYLLFVWVLGAL